MIDDYTNTSAYLVRKGIAELYDGVPSASPLTISATPPTVNYRCQVTATSVTGHTDCSGSVTIAGEAMSFTFSGQKKVYTTTISANTKPTVTYSGLDCNLLIECIDVGGAPIEVETLTSIYVQLEPHQTAIPQDNGTWLRVTDTAINTESEVFVNDIIRVNSTDYRLKKVDPIYDLGGEIDHYECTS